MSLFFVMTILALCFIFPELVCQYRFPESLSTRTTHKTAGFPHCHSSTELIQPSMVRVRIMVYFQFGIWVGLMKRAQQDFPFTMGLRGIITPLIFSVHYQIMVNLPNTVKDIWTSTDKCRTLLFILLATKIFN